jgi:hypothetical protein
MPERVRTKLVYTSEVRLLATAQSIQTKSLSGDQRQCRLLRRDTQYMTSAELHELKERIMEAIKRKRTHS